MGASVRRLLTKFVLKRWPSAANVIGILAICTFLIGMPPIKGTAFGGNCASEIETINRLLQWSSPLPPNILAEVERLRDEAAVACKRGDAEQALALIAEAKKLIGID